MVYSLRFTLLIIFGMNHSIDFWDLEAWHLNIHPTDFKAVKLGSRSRWVQILVSLCLIIIMIKDKMWGVNLLILKHNCFRNANRHTFLNNQSGILLSNFLLKHIQQQINCTRNRKVSLSLWSNPSELNLLDKDSLLTKRKKFENKFGKNICHNFLW